MIMVVRIMAIGGRWIAGAMGVGIGVLRIVMPVALMSVRLRRVACLMQETQMQMVHHGVLQEAQHTHTYRDVHNQPHTKDITGLAQRSQ